LASEDQSFEFHVELSQVSKLVILEKETPAKTLRIIRLVNSDGDTISSLILADSTEEAIKWYHNDLIGKYGCEIQL
jgi:hypothetical protein